jgi:hypothetical protein
MCAFGTAPWPASRISAFAAISLHCAVNPRCNKDQPPPASTEFHASSAAASDPTPPHDDLPRASRRQSTPTHHGGASRRPRPWPPTGARRPRVAPLSFHRRASCPSGFRRPTPPTSPPGLRCRNVRIGDAGCCGVVCQLGFLPACAGFWDLHGAAFAYRGLRMRALSVVVEGGQVVAGGFRGWASVAERGLDA